MQYTVLKALPTSNFLDGDFTPGRGLSPTCLEQNQEHSDWWWYCDELTRDAENSSGSRLASQRDANRIVNVSEGWLIMPGSYPVNIDFDATTFGSFTSCKVVTNLCDIIPRSLFGHTMFAYDCRHEKAGLDLTGNFSDIRSSSANRFTADYGFTLREYTDPTFKIYFDSTEERNLSGPTFWNAAVIQVLMEFVGNRDLLLTKTMVESSQSKESDRRENSYYASSILSCTTTVSDVVRPFLNDISFDAMDHIRWIETLNSKLIHGAFRIILFSTTPSLFVPGRP